MKNTYIFCSVPIAKQCNFYDVIKTKECNKKQNKTKLLLEKTK